MMIEQHIEELLADLQSACHAAERREIQTKLDLAQAELAMIRAEEAEPPY